MVESFVGAGAIVITVYIIVIKIKRKKKQSKVVGIVKTEIEVTPTIISMKPDP